MDFIFNIPEIFVAVILQVENLHELRKLALLSKYHYQIYKDIEIITKKSILNLKSTENDLSNFLSYQIVKQLKSSKVLAFTDLLNVLHKYPMKIRQLIPCDFFYNIKIDNTLKKEIRKIIQEVIETEDIESLRKIIKRRFFNIYQDKNILHIIYHDIIVKVDLEKYANNICIREILKIQDFFDAIYKNIEIKKVEDFILGGLNVDVRSNNASTALHKAIFIGNYQIVRLLLDHGANISLLDDEGNTVLHRVFRAIKYQWNESYLFILDKIISSKLVDINIKNNNGYTALHIFLSSVGILPGGIKKLIVKYLLENGANPNIVDNFGNNVLHIYKTNSFYDNNIDLEIVELLIKYGADVNKKNKYELLPISNFILDNINADLILFMFKKIDIKLMNTQDIKSIIYHFNNEKGFNKICKKLKRELNIRKTRVSPSKWRVVVRAKNETKRAK